MRLIVEVLDHWQDIGLTAGERGDLLVLAENANDKSRETWGPVHAPHVLKRAGKAAPSWRIAINRLMKKKALEFAKRDGKEVRGYTGQHAVYRLVELCPNPPHSGYKGLCTKPEKEGYPSANPLGSDQEEGYQTANPQGYLTANAVDGLGYLTDTERVSGQLTPTPPLSSFDLSSKDSPSSSPAEDVSETSGTGTEGGGGGGESFFEELHRQSERVDAFVRELDFRGKPLGKNQGLKIRQRLTAAFKDGWTERGLARYLDISDERNVRSAAALYLHRLSEEELPAADEAEAIAGALPPPCTTCSFKPGAAADPSLRISPLGGPCPDCHPDAVGATTVNLPPVCDRCREGNPAAEFNVRFRVDPLSFTGGPCPDCHPAKVPGTWSWPGMDTADGGMWERAAARAHARSDADYGLPGDRNIRGWGDVARSLAGPPQPQIARSGHKPYEPPQDRSVYNNGFGGYQPYRDPADDSVYDKEL
ncbi:hypothetical protein [Streptomyces sp. C1-2]|uniref:hypothetical protein n=1 Tax=Streptomyces sp. C1-2 TaxID=2720022 RepID=UPI0014325E66|nr:hypothetical protein [Streptomyces sp. C1-2]NJP72514.1 hypothetical protein [Streptomyces sp. C1-2]